MSSGGSRARGIRGAAAALALLLAACTTPSRVQRADTPPDPPPLPARKPDVALGIPSSRFVGATHRVQRGDNLYSVSLRFGVPLRDLIEANALRPPYVLTEGERIFVPRPRQHVVQRGETVYGISRAYGVGVAELVRMNRIAPPYTISVGQRLLVPAGTAARAAESPAPAAVAVSRPPARAAAAPPSPVPDTRSVQRPAAPAPPAAAIANPPPRAGGKFRWPVRGRLVASFGPQGDGRHNDGVNIAVPAGTAVEAAENGVVAYAGNELRGFGYLVLLKHRDGWVTAYAHNEALLVRRGDLVKRGQPIARVGTTGSVTEPQLHFEIRKGTRAVDPIGMLESRRGTARRPWPSRQALPQPSRQILDELTGDAA